MNFELRVVEEKTAGQRVRVRELYPASPNIIETCVQNEADFGYNFIGIIDRKDPTGIFLGSVTLLFVRDK